MSCGGKPRHRGVELETIAEQLSASGSLVKPRDSWLRHRTLRTLNEVLGSYIYESKGFVPPEAMQGAIMRDVKKRPVDFAPGCDEERKIQLT